MRELPILVQRSAITDYQRCHRSRYLGYEWNKGVDVLSLELPNVNDNQVGVKHVGGLKPNKPQFYFAVGSGCHKAAEHLLSSYKHLVELDPTKYGDSWVPSENMIECAVLLGLKEFDKDILPYYQTLGQRGYAQGETVSLDDEGEAEVFNQYTYQEQRALTEALIRAWALAPMGLRWLVEEYEVLEVELEITCPLGLTSQLICEDCKTTFHTDHANRPMAGGMECPACGLKNIKANPEMMLMARPDAILRHRQTGGIYVWSLKTTKTWDKRKEKIGEYDVQGISELYAVEWWLRSQPDTWLTPGLFKNAEVPKVAGIQMTHLLKGYSSKDANDNNQYKTSNGLIRPYHNPAILDDDEAYRLKYEYFDPVENKNKRLGKGWGRVDLFNCDSSLNNVQGTTVKDNVDRFNKDDESSGCNYLDQYVVNPVPHYRTQLDVEEWVLQTVSQEQRIYEAGKKMRLAESLGGAKVVRQVMADVFPKYRHSCTYPVLCQWIPICHEGLGGQELESGKYRLRTPNHPQEQQGSAK